MRIIIEMCYVPNLQKNLIFLSTLDKQGYKYMIEVETMNVTKGSLVLLKVKLENVLYTLGGSTISGYVNAAASTV